MKKLLIIFFLLPFGLKAQSQQNNYWQFSAGFATNYRTQYVLGAGYNLKGFGLRLNYGQTINYGREPVGRKFKEINLDYTVASTDDILNIKVGALYSKDTYYLYRIVDEEYPQYHDTYGGYIRLEMDICKVAGIFWHFTYDNLQNHAARIGAQVKIR